MIFKILNNIFFGLIGEIYAKIVVFISYYWDVRAKPVISKNRIWKSRYRIECMLLLCWFNVVGQGIITAGDWLTIIMGREMEITFLGTGSAHPSPKRAASSIVLRLVEKICMELRKLAYGYTCTRIHGHTHYTHILVLWKAMIKPDWWKKSFFAKMHITEV